MGITWEMLENANKSIKKTDVKGKEYAEVNQRIKAFRMVYPGGRISTEILKLDDGMVIMKAEVYNEENYLLGTGTAFEVQGASFINKTSYIENCETSATGRALGMCGFGIDTSVASAEEVSNAIHQQETKAEEPKVDEIKIKVLTDLMKKKGVSEEKILARYKLKSMKDMTVDMFVKACSGLEKTPDAKIELGFKEA